jgi:hypothetical protein
MTANQTLQPTAGPARYFSLCDDALLGFVGLRCRQPWLSFVLLGGVLRKES